MQPERSLSCPSIPQGTGGMESVFPCQQAPRGLGFPGLGSQASLMEKINHFEQGRVRVMELEQQSRALLPQDLQRAAPKLICNT